ncbi:MAG: extracellular solute-binding protein [Bacteroidota bacterium]
MQRQQRKVLLLMVLIIFGIGMFVSAAPAEKVVVFVRTGIEADAIRAVAKAYTAKTGNPVELMEAGRSGFYQAVQTQLIGGSDKFDLAQANDVDIAYLAEAGVIAPIDKYVRAKLITLNDFPFVYRYKGKTYALPFDVSTLFLYYRSDLIPNPPQTWDEYLEVARKWTKSLNPQSPTLYGAGFTALAGSEQPKMYYSIMWSKGGWIVDAKGNVGVDSPGAIAAGEYLAKFRAEKLVAPDVYAWGFSNVLDALDTGVIAMASPYWNAAYPTIKAGQSPYKDKIRLALVPGERQKDGSILRTPFQQGKVLILNANSKHKDAAWSFYDYLISKEGSLINAKAGGTPARLSVMNDRSMQPKEYYEMMRASLKIALGDPGLPFYPAQHEAMNQALSAIMTGTSTPKAALEQAGRIIRGLVKEWQKNP